MTLGQALHRHSALRKLFVRAFFVYVGAHLMAAAVGLSGSTGPDLDVSTILSSPFLFVALVALLGYIDTRVRREQLFWANLGYSSWHLVAIYAAIALVGELLLTPLR